ncbi:MAG: DUF433 domain-containing protein [Verrucomicrobiota bacterium]
MLEFTRITQDPDVLEGAPCIRHLHVTVGTLLSLIAAGRTPEEIMATHEELRMEDLREALLFAAWRVEESGSMHPPAKKLEKSQAPVGSPAPAASPETPSAQPTPPPAQTQPAEASTPRRAERPCLVLTRVGLFDRRLGVGIIAWRDIHNISVVNRNKKETVCLEIIQPQRYFHRMPASERHQAKLQSLFRVAPFCISPENTGLSAEELELRIKKIWVIFRNDSWRASKTIPVFEEIIDEPAEIQPLPPDPASQPAEPTPENPALADMIHFPEELKRELSWEPPKAPEPEGDGDRK